jgi:phytoene synthase
MLGQMRLAWWREMLGKPAAERPRGDAVLDAIGEYWREGARGLVPLVDGWEHILGGDRLGEAAIDAFAEGRAAALLDPFGGTAGLADKTMQSARSAAEQWALADLASNVSDADERAIVIRRGLAKRVPAKRLPRELRGLAVLGALARRALERGGRPLLEGRGAALIAARAALFGR